MSAVRSRRWSWGAVALAAGLVWLVAYPIALSAVEGVRGPGGWTLEFVRAFFARPNEWQALWGSLWISVATVACSAAIGVPLAFLFARTHFPGRRVLGALVGLPVALPPLVGVLAFLFLYGESGFVAHLVKWVTGAREAPWQLQGAGAILLVHAYSMYVYFYLLVRAALERMDGAALEAAASLGAGRWRAFTRVTLPMLRPTLTGAALLTFTTSLASFSAPYIFGGGFRVMTTQVLATRLNGDTRLAAVETVTLTLIALLALALLGAERGEVARGGGKGSAPARREVRGAARALATVGGWGLAAVLLLPHATLLLLSFVTPGTWTVQAVPPSYTLANYTGLAGDPERLRPLVNSLWMASVATLAALALAVWAGQLVVRRRARGARLIETLLAAPWAVPGTVFALALATAFSVHRPWALQVVLVGTLWILPLAYLIRDLPVASRPILAGFRQLDPALEEAAAGLGASRWTVLRRVTLPLLAPALAAAGALAFVTALGDFVTSVLLYTYDTRPLSLEILGSLRSGEIGVAAVYGVLLMGASAAVFLLGARAGNDAR
ncbi:MAG TPA: iron ABC transporter permease [Gemmatimonadales bacterium]|nr:iron ABC transporter permease [Gemmatimonadales bacterium]